MGAKGTSCVLLGGGSELAQSLCKLVWKFVKKLRIDLDYVLVIPLLGVYPEGCNNLAHSVEMLALCCSREPSCGVNHGSDSRGIKKIDLWTYRIFFSTMKDNVVFLAGKECY